MLQLPRFKIETDLIDLVSPLKSLGMDLAFGINADFRGMGGAKGELWIAQVKHKAVVEVNEDGTEVAAATAVEMRTKGMPRYPRFCADHPFIFIIRDRVSGTILFIGGMSDPGGELLSFK